MADYKAIRGFTIHTVDGDPSNLVAGQVWYNSSSKKVKGKTFVFERSDLWEANCHDFLNILFKESDKYCGSV